MGISTVRGNGEIISLPLVGGIIDEFNFLFYAFWYFPNISQEAYIIFIIRKIYSIELVFKCYSSAQF